MPVGGLTAQEARGLLERRAERLERVPVTFVAAGEEVRLTPAQLGVEVDWASAVDAARREADGFGPVRGLRRLETRVFGAEIEPPARVSASVLRFVLHRIGERVRRAPRESAIVLRGLRPELVPPRRGRSLERRAAETAIVRTLARLTRNGPVRLPVRVDEPAVTMRELRPALAEVRIAVSAPVRLRLGPTRWRLRRWRVAELLLLPSGGRTTLEIGGPGTRRLFARLRRRVDRPAREADFVARSDGTVVVTPSAPGRALDDEATRGSLLAAATSRTARVARVRVRSVAPQLTTAEARALGVTRVLATYSTVYAGTPDRTRNLQLAVSLLDRTVVPPGGTFSLNAVVGPRTLERGFRPAPVIVGDEYQEGVGGGVSQVATTVFNAAWEAGLRILERHPHSLYISRYPLGRDATVNYPDLDLRFANDTGRAIVVRGFAGASGITIALYGRATGRHVVSEPGPLVATGAVPVEMVRDASLPAGTAVVEEEGAPPQSVAVVRVVYDRQGKALRRETWRTSYRGEDRVLRVGTQPKPEPRPERPKGEEKQRTQTTTTETEREPTPPPPAGSRP
ncbi:MAG: VanW family protein [Thermoleophilia bacterium]|nr:VanW family protein [Thermoleophilia bacterium]